MKCLLPRVFLFFGGIEPSIIALFGPFSRATPSAQRQETRRCEAKQKHARRFTPRVRTVRAPYLPEDVETYADELAPNSPAPRTKRDVIDAHAAAHAEDAWRARVAPGDDGDACYLGFADTTLLDFVSRGLDNRPEKRVGDFDPSHRIAVFTEPESTGADGTARHSSSDDEDDARLPDMRPRWVSVVSQLDVLDLMVSDADALGSFPRTATMESLGFTRGTFAVAAVSSDFSAAGCFAVMHNLGVSGLAVVDRRGRFMIGSISASDVRRVSSAADLADALSSSVGEFLRDRVWSKVPGRGRINAMQSPILISYSLLPRTYESSSRKLHLRGELTGRCVREMRFAA